MRLVSDPVFGEVDLSGSAEELMALAAAVTAGQGLVRADESTGGTTEEAATGSLAGVEVRAGAGPDTGPGVRIHVDARHALLVISGDPAARAILAANLRGMAESDDGGHLHVDHFPDHPYLAEGSVPLVVNSPLGGMPRC